MMRKMAPWLVALVVGPAAATAAASAEHNSADGDRWVSPQGLNEGHNGGTLERLVPPAVGAKRFAILRLRWYVGDVDVHYKSSKFLTLHHSFIAIALRSS
jgi:hypothetical protein